MTRPVLPTIDKSMHVPYKLGTIQNSLLPSFRIEQIYFFWPTQHSTSMGYMEPLLPMARHPKVYFNVKAHLFDMGYLIHDFYRMCQKLTPFSKLIFFDMGASLDYHTKDGASPNTHIHQIYNKFGFVFDQIYAYKVTPKKAPDVYEMIPDQLLSSWHWINVLECR